MIDRWLGVVSCHVFTGGPWSLRFLWIWRHDSRTRWQHSSLLSRRNQRHQRIYPETFTLNPESLQTMKRDGCIENPIFWNPAAGVIRLLPDCFIKCHKCWNLNQAGICCVTWCRRKMWISLFKVLAFFALWQLFFYIMWEREKINTKHCS